MASATTLEPVFSAERFLPDKALYEVVKGKIVEIPPMSAYASWITSRLCNLMWPTVVDHKLGNLVTEMMFIFDPVANERRRPDLAFVSAQRWPLHRLIPKTGDWEVIPDLAVEVISPSEIFEDVVAKVAEYFQYSVKQVWLVLPRCSQLLVFESATSVRILAAADAIDGGDLLPGFRLPVASIFQSESNNGTPRS